VTFCATRTCEYQVSLSTTPSAGNFSAGRF
jgi:hypothetical protein